jgi:hypothetical protein
VRPKYDTTLKPHKTAMPEQFIELIKKARTASPTEKLQIEVALSLVVVELLIDPPIRSLPCQQPPISTPFMN